ncbi:porin [Psychrobacter celer]|uniref:porin n=1 Tax=Psychrobacter celer TaxID=306572 RepID=UPI0026F84D56|nr:porin [Psychrobacter sp.]
MKKLLLATAVAALSVSAANAAPTVYGKVFLTLDAIEADDGFAGNVGNSDERTQLRSNSSRIGLKGSEALTANTDVVYQLEYGVDVDNDSDQFYSRDTFIGLENAQYGKVLAGRLTTIDDNINFTNVASGGVLGDDAILSSFDAPRANNSFAYFSPENNGMQFMAMYVMDEDNLTSVTDYADEDGNFDERDAFALAAKYEVAQVKAGASYIQSGDSKIARINGSYDIAPQLTVAALYQMADYAAADEKENTFTVSGQMKTATPWTTYAQADVTQNYAGFEDADAYRVLAGGKYAFNAATTGHLYGAYANLDDGSDDADGFGLGGGIEYKF